MPFDATTRTNRAIPFAFEDYPELVDWSGRALHPHKRGFIAEDRPKILDRLGFDSDTFIEYGGRLLKEFGNAVGAPESIAHYYARRQSKYLRGFPAGKKNVRRRSRGVNIGPQQLSVFNKPAQGLSVKPEHPVFLTRFPPQMPRTPAP